VLYSGTILVDNLTDIAGAVADEATIDITFTCNSKTALATTGTFKTTKRKGLTWQS
jgi:hypothetical protein